jgi:stage V sporulation protein K
MEGYLMNTVMSEEERRRDFMKMFFYNELQMTKKPVVISKNDAASTFMNDGLVPEVRDALQHIEGMHHVKKQISSYMNVYRFNAARTQQGLASQPVSMNMVFTGNPGTGKTTIARSVGKLLYQAGALTKGHVVEITPGDLFFDPRCGTEIEEMKERIKEAKGGVLFIDEAHNFPEHAGSGSQFWRNAVTVLLQSVTLEKKPNFAVVLAGYEEGIKYLFRQEPGLGSRFPNQINFPDYSDKELVKIFERYAESSQYNLAKGSQELLLKTIHDTPHRLAKDFGNARYVQNLFNETVKCVADRVSSSYSLSIEDITTITAFDIQNADSRSNPQNRKSISKLSVVE